MRRDAYTTLIHDACVPALLLDNSNYRFSIKNYDETCVNGWSESRDLSLLRKVFFVSTLLYKD